MAHFGACLGVKKSKISKLLENGGELGESEEDVILQCWDVYHPACVVLASPRYGRLRFKNGQKWPFQAIFGVQEEKNDYISS